MHHFIETYVDADEFATTILPVMEKAILRNPELSQGCTPAVLYFIILYVNIISSDNSILSGLFSVHLGGFVPQDFDARVQQRKIE
jgi:hypothetical protein